ncbi:MAG: GNAT family N-acetyltransferase [Pseudomonadota bacterium]
MTLRITEMTLDHLRIAVDWAAAEGWNPGLEDAEAFYGVDRAGFLMGWLGDVPVTAISVVRHSDSFGFLGFYLCHPDQRGKGYGLATWQAGMAHLGTRAVGLDGVPAQESNYRRSGFTLSHYTKRYAGRIDGVTHPSCRPATQADLAALLQMDRKISGTDRAAYMSRWLSQSETRQTLVFEASGRITAFGAIRTCKEGHKIGPLFAPEAETAMSLITSLIAVTDAQDVMIDIPDPNQVGVDLARSLNFEQVFSCARMYHGVPLIRQTSSIFGETTFELG